MTHHGARIGVVAQPLDDFKTLDTFDDHQDLTVGQSMRAENLQYRSDEGTLIVASDIGTALNEARAKASLTLDVSEESVVSRLENAEADRLMRKYHHPQREHRELAVRHYSQPTGER